MVSIKPVMKAVAASATTFVALMMAQLGLGEAPPPEAVEGAIEAVALPIREIILSLFGAAVQYAVTWAVPNREPSA